MRHITRDLILYSHFLDLIASAVRLFFAPVRWLYGFVWGRRPTPALIEFINLAYRTGSPCSNRCDAFLRDHRGDEDLQRRAKAYKRLWDKARRNCT